MLRVTSSGSSMRVATVIRTPMFLPAEFQETAPPVHDVQLLVLGRDLIVDVADPQRHAPPVAAQIRDPVGQHRIIANQFLRRTRNATVLRPACPGHLPMPQSTAFDRLIVFDIRHDDARSFP